MSVGKIPFAPHLLFPLFMDDTDPDERELAMFFNRFLPPNAKPCGHTWVKLAPVCAWRSGGHATSTYRLSFFDSDFKEVTP